MRKLVFGVGINDADYVTQVNENLGYTDEGKKIQKQIWMCPYFLTWRNMLKRCYKQENRKSYKDCQVTPAWHYFMTFRAWMVQQEWKGKHLDKDILFPGNKVYSPETCLFVAANINTFLTESNATRGEWPIGVSFHKPSGSFSAQCSDVINGKQKYLGLFPTPELAHKSWLSFKLEQAKILAGQQSDPRVAKALINRYKNYQSLDSNPNLAYNG